jgi:hypothetical protein
MAEGSTARASGRMRPRAILVTVLVLLAACGGDDGGDSPGRSSAPPAPETGPEGAITVPLMEENNSGASGTATLAGGGSASVTIELRADKGIYRAHIHDVSCKRYRRMNDFSAQLATLNEGLNSVADGSSESELSKPVLSYTRSEFSINVHKFASPYPVVACGDLSAR